MAIIVGSNSWVTLAEANAYFTTRPGSVDWFNLPDDPTANPGGDSKESFLITAFFWLVDDPGYGLTPELTDDYIDRAQEEAALFLLKYMNSYEERMAKIAGGVSDFKQSKWEETLGQVTKPQNIQDLVSKAGFSSSNAIYQSHGDIY